MIDFKYKKDETLFSAVHPILIMIFADLYSYAYDKYKIRLVVTQTITNKFIDKNLKRKSPSHSEHRAIDIRTIGVGSMVVDDLKNYINNKKEYQKYKYLSNSGHKRLAYWHVGNAEHLHLAIHSKFAIKK